MGKLHSFRKCRVFAGISFGLELLKTPPGGRGILESPSGVLLSPQAALEPGRTACWDCILRPRGRVSTPRGSVPSGGSSVLLSCCHLPSHIEFSVRGAALRVTSQVLASSLHRQGCTECQREVWVAEPGPWNWKDLAPVLVLSRSGSSASPQAAAPALQALVSAWVREPLVPHCPVFRVPSFLSLPVFLKGDTLEGGKRWTLPTDSIITKTKKLGLVQYCQLQALFRFH